MNATTVKKAKMTDNIEGIKAILIGGIALGTLAEFFEAVVGLSVFAYIALVALFILDFFTGIAASVNRGELITSRKMPRIIMKIMIITVILTIVNIFSKEMGGVEAIGISFNFYSWIYLIILNICVLSQIFSVLENLRDVGTKWAAVAIKAIETGAEKIWFLKYLKRKKK